MKSFLNQLTILAASAILIGGCSSGQKAYERGDYYKAASQAVKRLKSSPENEKASNVLINAYPSAVDWGMRTVSQANRSTDPFRNEAVAIEYGRLNLLAENILKTPAARALIPAPKEFQAEENAAAKAAAQQRLSVAQQLLATGTKPAAQDAVRHLEAAVRFQPHDSQLQGQLDLAFGLALTDVLIRPVLLPATGLNANQLEQHLNRYIERNLNQRFLQFTTNEEAAQIPNYQPDLILEVHLEAFEHILNDRKVSEEPFQKDNVVIGQTRGIPPQDVYGTVKGRLSITSLNEIAQLPTALHIVSANGTILLDKHFASSTERTSRWATLRGDERAIPDAEKALLDKKEPESLLSQSTLDRLTTEVMKDLEKELRAYFTK